MTNVTDLLFYARHNECEGHSYMKLTTLVITLALALASVAQTGSQPTAPSQDAKPCACCNHENGEGSAKTSCADCGKEGKCSIMSGRHAGMKCPMMSKDGKMADGKMADGKMCCSSNKCPMHAKQGKGCCSGNMNESKQSGM